MVRARPHLLAGPPARPPQPRAARRPPTPCSRWSATRSRAARPRCAAPGPRRRAAPLVDGHRGLPRGPRRADRGPDRRRRAAARCCGSAGSRPRSARPRAGSSRRCERASAPRPTRRPTGPRRPGTSACRPPLLWWRRLAAHFTPRSVYFQNAVRLALGLAAARLAADLLDLSHGFWVLLATLSLMRTSLVASGLALVPAFLGTLGGAFVAAGVLALVGDDTIVYAVVLPIAMVVTFAAGPLLGPAAAQFGFTVVVSVLFAQLAPTTWQVAEVRLTDVVVGGLIGALIGAAVWPRGGAGEVRRSAALCLRSTADELVATVRALAGVPAARVQGSTGCGPTPRTGSPCCSTSPTPSTAASPPAPARARLAGGARRRAAGGVGRRGAARPLPGARPAAVAHRLPAARRGRRGRRQGVPRGGRSPAGGRAPIPRTGTWRNASTPTRRAPGSPTTRTPPCASSTPGAGCTACPRTSPSHEPPPYEAPRYPAHGETLRPPRALYRGGMSTAVGLEAARRAFLAGEWSEARAAEVVRPRGGGVVGTVPRGGLDPDTAVATFQGLDTASTSGRIPARRCSTRSPRPARAAASCCSTPTASCAPAPTPTRTWPGCSTACASCPGTGSARRRWAPPRPPSRWRPGRPWPCPGPSTTPPRSPASPRRRRRSPTPTAWSARSRWSATRRRPRRCSCRWPACSPRRSPSTSRASRTARSARSWRGCAPSATARTGRWPPTGTPCSPTPPPASSTAPTCARWATSCSRAWRWTSTGTGTSTCRPRAAPTSSWSRCCWRASRSARCSRPGPPPRRAWPRRRAGRARTSPRRHAATTPRTCAATAAPSTRRPASGPTASCSPRSCGPGRRWRRASGRAGTTC